ncbi:MAG: AAA family ATPase [Bacilli bacterium]|nr:AAA family ATPase [Bacilli bacterium]
MYLKEIEMSGFKSFADKITLNLDNNITCIVGPNGSGKSNVVDAIRFVLGEQSVKSLRGDNLMADVIFSGSKNRSPMHSASVTLTFDNYDKYLNVPYDTVSVRRRLYKTGENEYFLNNERCRLKDIVDLFLDSNIGRDSFNIIGQGEISKILSNSASERRLVIEEASGILKYKKRREEAFKKLDKTNNNLERINDIVREVEARVEPLKNQSEKAREYLETKDALEKVEISLLSREITDANFEYQNIKNTIKEQEEKLIHLNTIINNPELDKLKLKEIEISKNIQELNNNLINKTKEKEELNSKRIIIKERAKYNSQDIKVYENIEYIKDHNLKLEKEIKLLESDLKKVTSKKESLENTLNNLIDSINEEKIKSENITRNYNIKKRENLELNNKLDILKNNLKDNVYLNSNVKKILDNPKLTGIIDALINVITVNKDYQTSFDVVSLTNKNFLIAEDDISIKEAINYLKRENLGRATFLPIKVIKPKIIDDDTFDILNKEKGYLGILSDFLEYDNKFQNIILNQYGNIIVTDTIENANIISKKINGRFRIVTLTGEIIHVGGSVTGGSFDIKSNLTIKNNINELSLKIKTNENNLSHLEVEIGTLENKINDIDRNIYENRSNLIKTIDELNEIKNKLTEKKHELKEKNEELQSLNGANIESYDQEYYDKSLECELLEKNIKELIKEKDIIVNNINELDGINKENRNLVSTLEKSNNELNINLSKLDMILDNNLNILNEEYNLTYERAKEEYDQDIDINEAKRKVSNLKNALKNIGMVNLDSIREYEEVNERYTYLSNERNDLLHAKEMLYSIIDDMDEVMKNDFFNTFKELEVEFKKVFKEMFHGGDASLKLTNPDNILETGIDIVASPPGKKLKTITLLSGGEKTLTAISLLFAILNIRRVPFCIFDEIEAALDEANVDNFGTYLEHYKLKTQFLLITHKKRTMEYAKTLYGITMQESGVSKLVSVRLEDKV